VQAALAQMGNRGILQ